MLCTVQTQIHSRAADEHIQKRAIGQGEVGTGKSTFIQAVTAEIAQVLGDGQFLLIRLEENCYKRPGAAEERRAVQ